MAQQKVQNVSEALERAKMEGEVFLGTLSREGLERSGFDISTFQYFEFADVYLQYVEDEYRLKYIFDTSTLTEYYEKASEIGGYEELVSVVASYLCLAEERDMAEIELVENYPLGTHDGTVYVYKVSPLSSKSGMRTEVFYIATFSDDNTEKVWGSGSTPQYAIQDAIFQYSGTGVSDDENPFRRVYDEVYSPES